MVQNQGEEEKRMTYRLMTPAEKGINRNRSIQHFCWLLGDKMYMQWAHASLHIKVNGKYTWQFPKERDEFMVFIIPEIDKFCGKHWEESRNPDAIHHPLRVAVEWHNGRKVKESFVKYYPHLLKMLPMIHERMVKLGISVNVPADEWTI
jgi:hypothetical protein